MHIAQDTEAFMEFFTKNYKSDIKHDYHNKTFKTIIKNIYNDIVKGQVWANTNFNKLSVNIHKIDIISQIPKPNGFNSVHFSSNVRNYILNNSHYVINYDFTIKYKKINISFIIDSDIQNKTEIYDCYIKNIMSWIYVANLYSSSSCGKNLNIYIYMTPIKKVLPNSRGDILAQDNINSGLSNTCQTNSEIIIYRKEEWFKVLIHETFHNYGLDFSAMNIPLRITNIMSDRFNITSDFAMYESYTEFWARIMNLIYCSYNLNMGSITSDFNNFYQYFKILLYYERIYNIYQSIKLLNFQYLKYNDLITNIRRDRCLQLYREDTNVFSYYTGVAILMINPIEFIIHCKNTNINIFRFKKTEANLELFYKYISDNSNTNKTIKIFSNINKLIAKTPKHLLQTCRMTLSDIDNCI